MKDLKDSTGYQVITKRIFTRALAILCILLFTFLGMQDLFQSRYLEFGFSFAAVLIFCFLFIDKKKKIHTTTLKLKNEIKERTQAEGINKTLVAISNAVNTTQNLKDLYLSIHHSLESIIDVSNFFIAIVDIKERTLYFPYHIDTTDDDYSPITDFDIHDSLTGLVISRRRPILLKKNELEDRVKQDGVRGVVPLIWMGVPLIIKDEVIGVVAAQSYIDPNLYNTQDLQILSAVSDQMAIAIDRKRAEEEKINAQKIAGESEKLALVGQVAGKMAHDFNNILGIIMGNAELSLLGCKDLKMKKNIELIFKQTLRGKNLTKNLIAFAKSQEPKQEFFKISDKIEFVINLMKKDLEGIKLITENKPGVPELLADPGMIEHSLVNLLQNSIHAVSKVENPKIIMRSFSFEDSICFEIEDNGCGIPKEHLESIYEPSFTLKGSHDVSGLYEPGIKGTGYGMSNVKKYIEQHKGKISVVSDIASGTKFTLSLPVIKKELTKKEKAQVQIGTAHFEKQILLVEDETAISDVQYRVLTQDPCNHRVDIAPNGQVAIELFDKNEYDFISLDYILPGIMNGMDVYRHIRETNKNIPILFISGNIEFLESIKELKQKDTNIDHLSKPCQNKDYVNSINGLLEKTLTHQH